MGGHWYNGPYPNDKPYDNVKYLSPRVGMRCAKPAPLPKHGRPGHIKVQVPEGPNRSLRDVSWEQRQPPKQPKDRKVDRSGGRVWKVEDRTKYKIHLPTGAPFNWDETSEV